MRPREAASAAAVARELRAAILAGEYGDGDAVPSRVELAERFRVSPETASVAIRMLAADGLLRLEQGKRTVVLPVHRYEVTVLVPLGKPVEEAVTARAERRVRVQEDDDPAIGGAAVAGDGTRLRITLDVTAADSGRAAARALGIAAYACPRADGWDLPGASVSATPA
jgi:DNA-binding transcriptional regulator YhcF (GntR family)